MLLSSVIRKNERVRLLLDHSVFCMRIINVCVLYYLPKKCTFHYCWDRFLFHLCQKNRSGHGNRCNNWNGCNHADYYTFSFSSLNLRISVKYNTDHRTVFVSNIVKHTLLLFFLVPMTKQHHMSEPKKDLFVNLD